MQNKTTLRFDLTVVRKDITKKTRNAGEKARGYHWWEIPVQPLWKSV